MLTVFVSIGPLLGATFAAVALVGLLFPGEVGQRLGLALPLMLVSAAGILGYFGYLRSLLGRRQEDRHVSSQTRAGTVVLFAVGLLGVLWWIGLYAAQAGDRAATDSAATLRDKPEIIVYSSDRIAVAGPGIVVDEIQQVGSKYRYRYSGLRLLTQTESKYILLPVGWQKGRDGVFLVPSNDTIRLDIIS